MELEEHFHPDEPRQDEVCLPPDDEECPGWVDAYEF